MAVTSMKLLEKCRIKVPPLAIAPWRWCTNLLWVGVLCGVAVGSGLPAMAEDWQYFPSQIDRNQEKWDAATNLLVMGNNAQQAGQLQTAIAHWTAALNLYQEIDDLSAQSEIYDYLSATYIQLGQFRQAESALRRKLGIARDQGRIPTEIYTLNNLGTLFLKDDRLGDAEDVFTQAATLARGYEDFQGAGLSLSNLGLLAMAQGNYPEAIKRFETAVLFRRRGDDAIGTANTLNNLGESRNAMADYEGALGAFFEAKAIAESSFDYKGQFRALAGLVRSYQGLEKYNYAVLFLNDWLALATVQNNPNQRLQVYIQGALFYDQLGNYTTARQFYGLAIALAETLNADYEQAFLRQKLSVLPAGPDEDS